ncbi:Ig-like domain repeat protein [Actinomadura sp. CNU-125]|uniref:Ig-like domain repeat protein n=1 Tax=Actinomadura sp. CNU-125 TaxID=1904961 RepID=UPI001178181D|nr:Ig-like domain repeat protein [Actinomadura sp. CNU-125]
MAKSPGAGGGARGADPGVRRGRGRRGGDGRVEDGIWLSVKDGDVLTGQVALAATDREGGEPVSIAIAGEEKETAQAEPKVDIVFDADGFEAGKGFKNSVWVNGTKVAEPGVSASGYSPVRVSVPASTFKAGPNTVRVLTGSTSMNDDPDNNNDDFKVRNLRLAFADGTTAADPSASPTTLFTIGDSTNMSRYHDWAIAMPAEQLLAQTTFAWNTTALKAGTYTVTAASKDGDRKAEAEVHVDHGAPVSMDLADGDVVSGAREIVAASDGPVKIGVDGEELPTEVRDSPDPAFVFEANGFQTSSFRNTVWLNGEIIAEPEVGTINNYADVAVTIPLADLRAGENRVRVRTGSGVDPVDEAGENNNDDFTIRDARLEFSGGRTVADPSVPPTEVLSIGDNINPKAYYKEFVLNVPDSYRTEYAALWDSSQVNDGTHEVVASKEGSVREASASIVVDNTVPAVKFNSPAAGERYKEKPFVVDVSAEDPHGVASLELTLDGAKVANGDRFTADDLKDGEHTLVAKAVDKLGNEGEKKIAFSTVGNYPLAPSEPTPENGAADVSPSGTTLGVTVQDPAGDAVDVAVKWAYTGDYGAEGNTATQGSSKTAAPGRAAGETVDEAAYAALKAKDGKVATAEGDDSYPFQQFEMQVPANLAAQQYTVNWNGTVPAGQRAALSVWNYADQKWQLLDDGEGGEDLALSGRASVTETVRDGKARVMVQDVAASVISEKDATFAWMTDTQHYSEREPETYQKMVDWALNNRYQKDIGYGVHTGDIVQNVGNSQEWANASRIMKSWDDAGFPYGIVPGNHDIGNGHYEVYRTHFGESRYAGKPWFGGTVDDNVQHYDIVSTPGADYLVMYLDWSLDAEEIAWANKVIKAHPEHNVIIATHQYITVGGAYYGPGQKIFDEIVLPNENVDMILSGHVHGVALNVKREGERVIVEVLADYQEVPTAGGGWMRTVGFDTANQTVSNETFSVLSDGNHYWDPEIENFTVPLDLQAPTRKVSTDYVGVTAMTSTTVGTVQDAESGSQVAVPAGELKPDTRYGWYVEATDADGYRTTSPVWSFTTGQNREATAMSVRDESTEFGRDARLRARDLPDDATGTVAFAAADGTVLCEADVDGGRAECRTPADLGTGAHAVTARYSGDERYGASSANLTLTVAKADPDLRGDGEADGAKAVLQAELDERATGTVVFRSADGTELCTGTIDKGAASCAPAAVPGSGDVKITVRYAGDANFTDTTDTFTLRR